MELKTRRIADFVVIDLPHDIFTDGNINYLKNTIVDLIEQGSPNILLNMIEISKIDGVGLGALLSFQKFSLYNKIRIRLYGLQPYVAQMMFQTRLNKVLDICQTEEPLHEEMLFDNMLTPHGEMIA